MEAGHISDPQVFSRINSNDNCYVKNDGLARIQYMTHTVTGVYGYPVEMSFYISQAHR